MTKGKSDKLAQKKKYLRHKIWEKNLRPEIPDWMNVARKSRLDSVGKYIMVGVNVMRDKCRVPLEADELVLLLLKEAPIMEFEKHIL